MIKTPVLTCFAFSQVPNYNGIVFISDVCYVIGNLCISKSILVISLKGRDYKYMRNAF